MKIPKLKGRLEYILSTIENNDGHFYDLCCDHGHLGLNVLKLYDFSKIFLIDQVPVIIEKLSLNIKDSDIPMPERLNIICLDATILKLKENKVNTILIAGIGGDLAIKILENLLPQLSIDDTVIISPHTELLKVRSYLRSSSLRLVSEGLVKERHKYYEVIKLKLSPAYEKVSLIGDRLIEKSNKKELLEYFDEQIKYYELKRKYSNKVIYEETLKEYKASKIKLL